MIVGVGVDVVDVSRFAQMLERTPRLADRLFTEAERAGRTVESLAARFAAKEALAKALRAPRGLVWHDAEVVNEPGGAPAFVVTGTVAEAVKAAGAEHLHVSLSHDGGVAIALVVAER